MLHRRHRLRRGFASVRVLAGQLDRSQAHFLGEASDLGNRTLGLIGQGTQFQAHNAKGATVVTRLGCEDVAVECQELEPPGNVVDEHHDGLHAVRLLLGRGGLGGVEPLLEGTGHLAAQDGGVLECLDHADRPVLVSGCAGQQGPRGDHVRPPFDFEDAAKGLSLAQDGLHELSIRVSAQVRGGAGGQRAERGDPAVAQIQGNAQAGGA